MRQPSEKLVALLERFGLCSQDQIRSVEPVVRRLARDLPEFDSVWIDALVERRILTPWQAEVLQSDNPGEVRLDDLILSGSLRPDCWLAHPVSGAGEYLVRRIIPSAELDLTQITDRFDRLFVKLDNCRKSAPRGLVLPERVILSEDQSEVFVVSRWRPGWSGRELLVRGGRLPGAAVAEIGGNF